MTGTGLVMPGARNGIIRPDRKSVSGSTVVTSSSFMILKKAVSRR